MEFASFLPYIVSIGACALNGILTYSLTRNRTRSGKATDTNAKSDGNPRVPLEKVIDAVTQWKLRYQRSEAQLQRSEAELANYRLESLLTQACKYVENLFPNADPQAKAEDIKKILPFLARELGIKNVQELEQASLVKPDIPDQIGEKTKVIE